MIRKLNLCFFGLALGLLFLINFNIEAKEHRVYIGVTKGEGIYSSVFDDVDGDLSKPKLVAELKRPSFLVTHKNKKYLYSVSRQKISNQKKGLVAAFEILKKDDGKLKLLNIQSSMGDGSCHVSLSNNGSNLLVANYGGGSVATLKINEDGSLKKSISWNQHVGSAQHPKRQTKPHPHSIYQNPINNYVYVPDLGMDKLIVYKLNEKEGVLTKTNEVEISGGSMGPRHMKWSADGKYAYILNEMKLSISLFELNKNTNKLKFIKNVNALNFNNYKEKTSEKIDFEKLRMSSSEIRIHPNSKFIYSANRDLNFNKRDSISVFKSESTSEGFTRIAVIPAPFLSIIRNFNIDPSGKWLIAGGQKSNNLAVFSIDPKTGIPKFTEKVISMNASPSCIDFL